MYYDLTIDSTFISRTDFYKVGVSLPDQTVAMRERAFVVGRDGYVVAGMAVMFAVLAVVVCRHRMALQRWLKDFFSKERQYVDEQMNDKGGEATGVFLLIAVGVLSLALIGFCGLVEGNGETAAGLPYGAIAVGGLMCLCFVYVKAWVYALVNWTFFDSESGERWMKGYLLLTGVTGVLFYLMALVDVFAPCGHEMVIGGVIGVAILYEILLFYRLLANFKVSKYGYLLVFLYFCAVELLPTLVMGWMAGGLDNDSIVKNLFY